MEIASVGQFEGWTPANYSEDKKCRICGLADMSNTNIFHTGTNKLLIKILTVYPIVMYQNDPLPKNICKKCVNNVNYFYNDVVRVMKTQNKWISNVRSIQPNHSYIEVLDYIEKTRTRAGTSIALTFGDIIGELPIDKLLALNTPSAAETRTTQSNARKRKPVSTTFSRPPTSLISASTVKECESHKETRTLRKSKESPQINDLKSILELNGCSLLPVAAVKNQKDIGKASDSEDTEVASQFFNNFGNELKAETFYEADDGVSVRSPLSSPPPTLMSCRYCQQKCDSMQSLSTHQLKHFRLSITKLLERKKLNKSGRRGRVITYHNRKCVRCLNCWRIFSDNKSIVDHWTLGQCEFYCQICGEEYAQAPKLLWEHMSTEHGIKLRSPKKRRRRLLIKGLEPAPPEVYLEKETEELTSNKQPKSPKEANVQAAITSPLPVKAEKPPLGNQSQTCSICFITFKNFKALNSHMRKHKSSTVGSSWKSLNSEKRLSTEDLKTCNDLESQMELSTNNLEGFSKVNMSTAGNVTTNQRNDSIVSTGIKVKPISEMQSLTANDSASATTNFSKSWVSLPESNYSPVMKDEPFECSIPTQLMSAESSNDNMLTGNNDNCSHNYLLTCEYCGESVETLEYENHLSQCHHQIA